MRTEMNRKERKREFLTLVFSFGGDLEGGKNRNPPPKKEPTRASEIDGFKNDPGRGGEVKKEGGLTSEHAVD